jgi:hypothetical protein
MAGESVDQPGNESLRRAVRPFSRCALARVQGALASDGVKINPLATGAWAFSRTLANEFPNLDVRSIDIALHEPNSASATRLCTSFFRAHPKPNYRSTKSCFAPCGPTRLIADFLLYDRANNRRRLVKRGHTLCSRAGVGFADYLPPASLKRLSFLASFCQIAAW